MTSYSTLMSSRIANTTQSVSFGQEYQRVQQDTPGWLDTQTRFQDGRYGAFAVWNDIEDDVRASVIEEKV